MGGPDDKSNLVDLTAKEHFIVHKLLVEIYPTSKELVNAMWCMSNLNNSMGRNYHVGAMEYERLKIKWGKIASEMMSGENNPMAGRNPHSVWVEKYGKEEADRLEKEKNERRSKTMKEKGLSEEHLAKLKEVNSNRVVTQETRKKLRDANKGENNPMFGRTGELNPMFGKCGELHPSYGTIRPEHSQKMTGEGNPMYGVGVYELWVQNYGEEEANNKNDIANNKRRVKLTGNKNAKTRKVICIETNVIFNSVTDAADHVGMKVGTLYNQIAGFTKTNKTTFRFYDESI
jgi:hypothetical protein